MTKEQVFFLSVLADHIHKRTTVPPEEIDWGQVITYATNHQVQGILWHQSKNYLSEKKELNEIYKKLEYAASSNLYYYGNYLNAYRELNQAFIDNHLQFIWVKGLEIAKLFPIPAYRTMGDMDIVVPNDQKKRCHEIITGLGYKAINEDYEISYKKRNVKLELHDHLIYRQNQENLRIAKYFNNCWNYVKMENDGSYSLDWGFHFIFLIEHTKRHFSGNGTGFRQFMDIAITSMERSDLDWGEIENSLKKIGLWEFAMVTFAFCKRWFGVDFPVVTRELDDYFYEESTDFVFKNGVFGYSNKNHREHAMEKRIRSSILPNGLRKAFIAFKYLFIPYKYMINLPYCSFLKGRAYLLPIAWGYRVIYIIRNKKGQLQTERKLLFESEDIFKYHDMLMTKWGL